MIRTIQASLQEWRSTPDTERLVLLLRGARQVGKTYSARELGKSFDYFLEINFEENPQIRNFFDLDLNPNRISELLAGYTGIPVVPGKTMIFFDEVQACPNCLRALRFFQEKMPQIHVIAAGSMLEFALKDQPTSGVGRITSLFMFPMTFWEFLSAEGSASIVEHLSKHDFDSPVDDTFHRLLLEKLRTYLLIGGLPAVVRTYCRSHDLRKCQDVLDNLITLLLDDLGKYRARVSVPGLRETLRSACRQAGGKFKYSTVSPDISHGEAKTMLELLRMAGLVFMVFHSDARGIPLGAQTNLKRFKVIPYDAGVYQRLLGLELSGQLVSDIGEMVHRGSLAEIFVGVEFAASTARHLAPELYYWHREDPQSNAEVDYVIQKGSSIYPVEIKAGRRGGMQSIRIFLKERLLPLGIRLSQENISRYQDILSIPLYMAGKIGDPVVRLQ